MMWKWVNQPTKRELSDSEAYSKWRCINLTTTIIITIIITRPDNEKQQRTVIFYISYLPRMIS